MRLFLASYRFGRHGDRFLELAGEPGRVAVIANACDSWPASARKSAVTSELVQLRRVGFTPDEIDLREFVSRPAEFESRLADYPVVWVRGGNTFVLRAQLARSGADAALIRRLSADTLCYAGYSAGACELAPALHGQETTDDPAEVRPTCGVDAPWDGLGLVDRPLVVHLASPTDPDGDSVRLAARYRADRTPHWPLTDDDVLVVHGDRTELAH
ncbi:MAG: type 1 glutamine amidotransferase-like domain-containing protein [Mycobacteriaceae bacterium]|nr:type 1 glutamine amidotransferase-like domain-containing protein [Mycobacteriaceae bacterium]